MARALPPEFFCVAPLTPRRVRRVLVIERGVQERAPSVTGLDVRTSHPVDERAQLFAWISGISATIESNIASIGIAFLEAGGDQFIFRSKTAV